LSVKRNFFLTMNESRKYLLSGEKKKKTITTEYLFYDSTDTYSGYRIGKYVETESYTLVVVYGWGEERGTM